MSAKGAAYDEARRLILASAEPNIYTIRLNDLGLEEIPDELWGFSNLKDLSLDGNRLTALPPEIGKLRGLEYLSIAGSQLTSIPPEIGDLGELRLLVLSRNNLSSLPPELSQLRELATLHLDDNVFTELPAFLGAMRSLANLTIESNPLPDALLALEAQGDGALLTYLESLLKHQAHLYEAKLVIVGEGKTGKTSLLARLLGEPFVVDRPTTHGLHTRELELPHPDLREQKLVLHAWDFGGQPVYRVTHQLFFSPGAVYLVLWSSRLGVEQCDLEGWIRRICLRVGHQARVLVVATYADTDDRLSRLDQGELRRNFGDVIAGFYEVDNATGRGVDQLKLAIARVAARLPQMGQPLAQTWVKAASELLSVPEPHITFERHAAICARHGLALRDARSLAGLLNGLGKVVYFGDEAQLSGEVILRPDWLTEAVSYVLEDPATNARAGILAHHRLADIWHPQPREDRTTYPPGLHPFFLRLMERFDICYRLEDSTSSLVAQLVPAERPQLSWTTNQLPGYREAQLKLVCAMDDDPPGIMPWLIVRTHRFSSGKHWQRGVFLQHEPHGTALVELRDRELEITVRAEYPQYLAHLLNDTVERLLRMWPGLTYRMTVPCPGSLEGRNCPGRFDLRVLQKLKAKYRVTTDCQRCAESFAVDALLSGFTPPQPDVLARLDDMKISIGQLAHGIRAILGAVTSDAKEAPRLFTLLPEDLTSWNPANWGMSAYRITLWCEYPECSHPVCPIGSDENGEYIARGSKRWLRRLAPYASLVGRILRAAIPIAGAVAKAGLDETLLKDVGPKLDLMEKLTKQLLEGDLDPIRNPELNPGLVTYAQGASLREFHSLLRELDKTRQWGGLRRVLMPSGDYLWLCERHFAELVPPMLTAEQLRASS